MNEIAPAMTSPNPAIAEREFSLILLLLALARHKKRIILVTMGVAVTAVAISLTLPNVYKAGTKLLPPQQAQSGAAGLLSQLGGAAGMAGGIAGLKNPNELYVGMLKSRTVADQLVKQFDLAKVYEVNSVEEARKLLERRTVVSAGKDGLISIEVEDTDKKLVAPLANAYVAALLKLTTSLAVTDATQRRVFFERQLEQAKDKLAAAEIRLRSGLDSQGVISVDSDSRAIVETVARVRAQVSAKEVELGSMSAFVTTNNVEYQRAREQLNSLRAELSKLENGRAPLRGGDSNLGKPAGLANIQIVRDVKYLQMLYEMLAKQYEGARLEEAKDNSLIQVLDTAVEPDKKFKPGRAVIVLLATLLAFFVACAAAVLSEMRAVLMQSPEYAGQWAQLKGYLRFR